MSDLVTTVVRAELVIPLVHRRSQLLLVCGTCRILLDLRTTVSNGSSFRASRRSLLGARFCCGAPLSDLVASKVSVRVTLSDIFSPTAVL